MIIDRITGQWRAIRSIDRRIDLSPWIVEDVEHAVGGDGVSGGGQDAHVHAVAREHRIGALEPLAGIVARISCR
jgi:hypothetical protein